MSRRVTPLDPDSPKGREVAARASEALAVVMFSIEQREAAEQAQAERQNRASPSWPAGRVAVNITEAAIALGVPRSWVRSAVTARQIPHHRIGRHVRFTREDLEQILADSETPIESAPTRIHSGRKSARKA